MPLPPPSDNPLVAIAERVRVVIARQPGHSLDEMAESLLLDPTPFRRMIEEPAAPLDAAFVLDVVAALAYRQAIDPHWLLSGKYDAAVHRQALLLGEPRAVNGLRRVRELVQEQFERQRRDTPPFLEFLSWKPFQSE